jgi:outer membrane protein OmpA-like peptidoglycan-associated protein
MSWRDLLAPSRRPAPRWTPSAAQETEAEDAGRAVAATGLRHMAPGADFAGVQLHTDTEAAELADELGARAFTYGSDVFLGGDARSGTDTAELVTHEAVHAGQQAAQGSPVLQFSPKDGNKAGPGASPPDEDFISDPDNWGAEDEHVLFSQDDIMLADETTLKAFAAKQTEAVEVFLHGYASSEGPAKYNFNLSAQRAVAVRRRLMELLPGGSRVVVFAHGDSKHFGAAEENRRVGISVIGPERDALVLRTQFGLPPRVRWPWPDKTPPPIPDPTTVVDPFPPGGGPRIDPTQLLPALPSGPYIPWYLMDNPAILGPSAIHGKSPGETGNITEQYRDLYLKYHRLGIPDQLKLGPIDLGAGELANKELKNSIQAYWERNDPTLIDQSNRDVGAHVLSYDLLDLFRDKPKKPKTDR